MNSSRFDNPGFWETSPLVRLHKVGYTTGMFGKVLNDMNSYGCDGQSGLPPGVDRQVVMCTHTFFDCDWVNDTVLTHTGSNPEDYTTSVMGNASVAWIKSVLDKGKTHPPFFAWIGPHAPHLPSTPAPWYLDHPIGNLKAPTADPPYNFSGTDHHPLVAGQPILDASDAASIDEEYASRMRSLLSVDDLVVGLHDLLQSYDEWDNTFVLYTSDHGYSLGQFRLPTHKMQVYENVLRVPFLIKGPGIAPGTSWDGIAGFVDLMPTIIDLATGNAPEDADGRSFAPFIIPTLSKPTKPWKTVHLTTYQSINTNDCIWTAPGVNACGRHPVDATTNSHTSIRIINETHNLLYAEFVNVTDPLSWNFRADVQFRALFDLAVDPWQLKNIYSTSSDQVKDQLHNQLLATDTCQNQPSCP